MEWWKREEIEKYKGKKVKYNNSLWVVKEVNWNERDEEFVYYIENSKGSSARVFEHNIQLAAL